MMGPVYMDTSALAKWYVNEEFSQEVEDFIRKQAPVAISSLTVVEMRCLLARRRRAGQLDAQFENRAYAAFLEDIRRGHLIRHQVPDAALEGAANLIASLPEIPLRTLDSMHLAIMMDIGTETLATADRIMAAAAVELELQVVGFMGES